MRIPYCKCKSCICSNCKKPFETWIKNKADSFKTTPRFGNNKCEKCYDLTNK